MRGVGGYYDKKLGIVRILCVSQFTIPETAATPPDPVGNITNTRSFQLYQASCTPDFSNLHIFRILFPSLSPITLAYALLYHTAEHWVKSSLSITPYYHDELTWSTADTEYSVPRVQVYTEYYFHPGWSVFPSFSRLPVDHWKKLQLPVFLPTGLTTNSQLSIRAQR